MADENTGKVVSALDDIANVIDVWTGRVKTTVTANLAAAKADGLTAGTVVGWSVTAVEMMLDGALRVATAVLDGVALFDDDDVPRDAKTVVKKVRITSESPLPNDLHLELVGHSTKRKVESSRIVLSPPSVTRGAIDVQVTVNVDGLPDDCYLGPIVGTASLVARPETLVFEHLTV